MEGLQVKEKMTMEELKERLKEACRKNKWNGGDALLERYFTDPGFTGSRYDFVRGFIYAMYSAGIITEKECYSFTDAMLENRF